MAVGVYVGDFDFSTAAATNVTQDVTTYGSGAALPDLSAAAAGTWAIIFNYIQANVSGVYNAHAITCIGFTTGAANSYVSAVSSTDAQGSSNTGRRMSAKCIDVCWTSGGSVAAADFTSMLAGGGFRITKNGPGNLGTMKVNFTLITGLTNATVVNWTPGAGTTAVVAGFNPDLVLTSTIGGGAVPAAGAYAYLGFGAFNRHGQQWFNSVFMNNGGSPSNTTRWQQTDAFIGVAQINETALHQSHFAGTYASGFYSAQSQNGGYGMISLCLGGISSRLGAFARIPGGVQPVPTRHGFTPRGALFSSYDEIPNSGPINNAIWSFGSYDGVNSRYAGCVDGDNQATTKANSAWGTNGVGVHLSYTPSVDGVMSVSNLGTNSLVIADTQLTYGYEELYCILGDAAIDSYPQTVMT